MNLIKTYFPYKLIQQQMKFKTQPHYQTQYQVKNNENKLKFRKTFQNQQKQNKITTIKSYDDLQNFNTLNKSPNKKANIQCNSLQKDLNPIKKQTNQQHTKLQINITRVQQKIKQMKINMFKQKKLKQKLIKQQLIKRQKVKQQNQQKRQQIREQIREQKRKQQKDQQKMQERIQALQAQTEQNCQSVLQQSQISILKDTVTQMSSPTYIIPQHQQNQYNHPNSLYYISQVVKSFKNIKSLAHEHIVQSLQIMRTLQMTKMPNKQQYSMRIIDLPRKTQYLGKKVLVFDLDQTLIHCNQSLFKSYDVKIQIKFSNGSTVEAGVNIRPYAKQILINLHKHFQIIIFTASQSCYADQVIKHLDPTSSIISHRLYRQHCYLCQQGKVFEQLRHVHKGFTHPKPSTFISLVDRQRNFQNGVPIIPYYYGKFDFQLLGLQKYLLGLIDVKDVRLVNANMFQLNKYYQYYDRPMRLVEHLYKPRIKHLQFNMHKLQN